MSRQVGASKNRKYSPSKLEAAVQMVESGSMSRKRAAMTFGVPRTTLIDKLSGRYKLGSKPGRSTVLTHAEELNLVEYCKLMASIGYPLKKDELLREVKKVLDHDKRATPFKNNLPGKDWFYGFQKRHPDISQRTAMGLGHQRAIISKAMIDGWFGGLMSFLQTEVMEWNTMIKDPRRCFNADESGFPLCVNTGKVLAEKGVKHVYQVTSGTKQQLTVMVCFNAFGDYVPPLIVFPGERFRDCGIQDFSEAIYGQTSNGWMDSELFVEFLKHLNSFVDEKAIQKPIILYVDGHSTHMSLEAASYCHENNIVLYCLFPNATHVLQPCDVGFFGPMKSSWKKEVKEWHIRNIGQTFTKRHFPAVFKAAWLRVAKIENAIHGFKRCGLFPLCPDNVDLSKLNPSKLHAQKETTVMNQETDIPSKSPSLTSPTDLPDNQSLSQTRIYDNTSKLQQTAQNENTTATSDFPETDLSQKSHLPAVVSVSSSDLPETSESLVVRPSSILETTSMTSPAMTSTVALRSPFVLPGPSGACPKFQVLNDVQNRESKVSPSFALLTVPELPPKKKANSMRQKLPKALSGSVALNMLKERETKKRLEEEAKRKRKEEREEKRKNRIEEKQKKQKIREEQKKMKELLKSKKSKKAQKRKLDESSSDSEADDPEYADTDDDYNEKALCPGCQTDDGDLDEWLFCSACKRKWHISCTGDAVLLEIPPDQIQQYPYICELCIE